MPDGTNPDREGRSLKRVGVIGGVVAIAIVATGIAARSHSQSQLTTWTKDQAVPTVTVIHAKPAAATGALTLPAQLDALQSAPIYARSSGYIRKWFVDIGDDVKPGQLLALIDAPEVDQQLAAARADLQTARANENLAATTAARWETMLAKDAVSKQETDEKKGDLAAKAAVSNAARANVSRLQYQLGYTRLTAPFAGVVTTRSTNVGALVTAGNAAATPLFTVSDISRIRIFVRVPQAYSAQVHPGMTVGLALPEYPGRKFTAEMVRSADAVDVTSGTVLVQLQAANGDRALKPGAFAQATFPISAAGGGAVELPASAMIIGAGGTQVAVLGSDGRVQLKTVTIGHDLGETVQISAGLSAKDNVIDNPPDSLQSGDKVQVRRG
ncbi:efflux RND transporter periplasmic adaptor subunit [Sphingomonas immobilis]|uniref:Efflux RND transporter periplasmic adaptor subunit n=1 Tax=Sphingomonas immobilis TaxID=3063997 RepID=A0ABT9A057_9SPHN|nr:efflux RND transporter periplasmic adaptor subunit [Sphingomonas sp. CA1-15]MDO7843204.1 efflux RND transporter periplasmic adaptor subunit [Sphingomonas sp. CA1-15]